MSTKGIYELGEMPPIGEVPQRMHAQVIRQDRFGEPRNAFNVEQVEVPSVEPGEVLVYVMAAGINYNNVWAALGSPVDVIAQHQREGDPTEFHVGGSDASGIVYAVGEGSPTSKSATRWWSIAAGGTARIPSSRRGGTLLPLRRPVSGGTR